MKLIFDWSRDDGMFTPEWRATVNQAAATFADLSWPILGAGPRDPLPVEVRPVLTTVAVAASFPWPSARIDFRHRGDWYTGPSPAFADTDLLTVATHELCHCLGFGSTDAWRRKTQGTEFAGEFSKALHGGPVPLSPDGRHWQEGIRFNGLQTLMDPTSGGRQPFTLLDLAGLLDLGYRDKNARFVEAVYWKYLGRAADEAGAAFWWNQLRQMSDPRQLVRAMLGGQEFIDLVMQLYK